MSKTDDTFWRQFGVILGLLVLFGFVVAFIARSIAGDAFDQQMNNPSAVAARIAPAGSVRVGDPGEVVAAAPVAVSAITTAPAVSEGEKIYSGVCQACHIAGVAGAPKLDDAAAWAPRIALGEDALVASVVNGKGAMPPMGGNPALTEPQVRAAVAYIISKTSGADTQGADAPKAAAASAAVQAAEAAAAVTSAAGETADKARAVAAETVESAKEIASDVADKAKEMAAAVTGAQQSPAAPAATPSTAAPSTAAPDTAAAAGKPGDQVYNSACIACHITGVANAPKLDDKAAWEPRAATGVSALVQSVLKGKGAMPPKGGAMALTDADIENGVRYMLEKAGVSAPD